MAEERQSAPHHLTLLYVTLCLWSHRLPRIGVTWFASPPLGGDRGLALSEEAPPQVAGYRHADSMVDASCGVGQYSSGSSYSSSYKSSSASGSGSGSASMEEDHMEGGYDYSFVSRVDDKYECPICCFVLRAPNQTKCGHRFCATCIRKWINEKTKPGHIAACPICSEPLDLDDLFSDNFAKREIMGLLVRCLHYEASCNAVMEIRHVNKHLGVCEHAVIQCPNGCSQSLKRMHMQDHLLNECVRRMLDCPVCRTPILIQQQKLHLEKDCPMVELTCELCNDSIPRSQLKAHMRDDCPKALVDCVFVKNGCSTMVERSQLDTHLHLSTQSHLRLLADNIESFRLAMHEQPSDKAPYLDPCGMSLGTAGADNVVTNDSGLSLTTTHSRRSNSTRSFSTHVMNPMDATGSALMAFPMESLSLNIPTGYLDPSSSLPPDEPPPAHSILMRRNRRQVLRQDSLGDGQQLEFSYLHSGDSVQQQQARSLDSQERSQLRKQVQDQASKMAQQTLKLSDLLAQNRTLMKRLDQQQTTMQQLEEQLVDCTSHNSSGVFIWKVENYRVKKLEAQRGSRTVIHSPGFYSSVYGYKLCVRLNLNGVESATGTHMSIFVHFMQGKYDDLLEWPFSGCISLSLLDQVAPPMYRQHITEMLMSKPALAAFQRPVTQRNHKGFGYLEFSPLSVIEDEGSSHCYRKNDAMYIKVKVEANSTEDAIK